MEKNIKVIHAFGNDALGDYDAVALAQLIRNKEITLKEVLEASIARARKVDPTINAIEQDNFIHVKQDSTPVNGIFAGVPTFIKDNIDLKGFPTRHGSQTLKNAQTVTKDGAFTRQYLRQGFVVMGKSRLPEFGLTPSTELPQPTRNPWNTDYIAGGSSSGAAALVAAGVVPIAHGNDGGGSIRIPAACCGLVGLKPSRGRTIDSELTRSLPINIISEGVVTRSVRDTTYFWAGMEKIFKNEKLRPIGLVEQPNKNRLKIGVIYDSISVKTDKETRQATLKAAKLLEDMGHYVEEIPIPIHKNFIDDFSHYWSMLSFLTLQFGQIIISPNFDSSQAESFTRGLKNSYQRQFYKTPPALYRLRKSYAKYAQVFKNYDILLSPTLAHTTPEIGYLSPELEFDQLFERLKKFIGFTPWNNAAGGPAISLPMGSTEMGLPIGIHFSADHGQERILLELALEIEDALSWRKIYKCSNI